MIYADNAATTKMSEAAIQTMVSVMNDNWGNPSSLYVTGQRAKDRRGTAAVQIPDNPGNAGGLGLARGSFEAARQQLITMLANYAGYKNSTTVLVFDGYRAKGNPGQKSRWEKVEIVYTKEGQTGDA